MKSSAKSCITLASPLPIYTQGQVAPYTPTRRILQVRIHHSLTSLMSFCHYITLSQIAQIVALRGDVALHRVVLYKAMFYFEHLLCLLGGEMRPQAGAT